MLSDRIQNSIDQINTQLGRHQLEGGALSFLILVFSVVAATPRNQFSVQDEFVGLII